jgi:chemotaxis protein MotB
MAEKDEKQPIIVRKKIIAAGAHGGAWKVAYADFVTAMMAFFLLLWLLNATTEEQRNGIADYFSPLSASKNTSGSGGVLGGLTVTAQGSLAGTSAPTVVALPSPTPPAEQTEGDYANDGLESGGSGTVKSAQDDSKAGLTDLSRVDLTQLNPEDIAQETLQKALAANEERQFQTAELDLRQAIQSVPELAALKESLLIERTPEGLRIQIVDQDRYSMFPAGSSQMYDQTRALLTQVAKAVSKLPNKLSITGHTDNMPFRRANYSNWELSAERANASRRVLLEGGISEDRLERVSGAADRDPLIREAPSSPRNRRISIVLLRQSPLPAGADPNEASRTLGLQDNLPIGG